MKYERFEQLPVWQSAVDLAVRMFSWTAQTVFRGKGDLANQLQRAALSISNNIAEGFERGTTNELITFLYYSRGSAGEVRSMLCVAERLAEFNEIRSEISEFKSLCESISRQIRAWASSLQNSEIKGQRHLNDDQRRRYDNRKRRDAFQTEMSKFMENMKKEIEQKRRE